MIGRVVIAVVWLVAAFLLPGTMRFPRVVDIYISDYYVAICKWWFILAVVVAVVIPLPVTTAKLFRSVR